MNETALTGLTIGIVAAGTVIAATAAFITHLNRRGGPGDDHTSAAGRTYGANPEPDDGGPELDRPVWQDHLTHTPGLDEELPRGITPRRPAQHTKEPEWP